MQPSANGPNSFSDLTKRTAEAVYIAVRYDMADENGETRRQRNARFGMAESPELEVPDAAAHVWGWFWQLSGRRYSGPEALTFADIGQWASLLQIEPLPDEVQMLMAMDDQYLRAVREDQKAARERAQQQ